MPSMKLLDAALLYAERGYSIIPTEGKRPALASWTRFTEQRADQATIERWHRSGVLQNIGLICGKVSGNLVVIDLDSMNAVKRWQEAFPHDLDTFTVQSGSGEGLHLYYKVENLPPTTRATAIEGGANFELRSNGCYVVAPPSTHPITKYLYRVIKPAPIKRLPHMQNEVAWIKSLIKEKHGGVMPPPSNRPLPRMVTRYWAAALEAEAANVKHAPKNSRNNTLYRASLKMGSVCASGHLHRSDVEAKLYEASVWNGLVADDGERQTRSTINSGINKGMESSRDRKRA